MDHLLLFLAMTACFCSLVSCSTISCSNLARRQCVSSRSIFHSSLPSPQYLKPVFLGTSFWEVVRAKQSLTSCSTLFLNSTSLTSRFSSTGTFWSTYCTSGWLMKSIWVVSELVLKIFSMALRSSENQARFYMMSMILRQLCCAGARKTMERSSLKYLVQLGKLEYISRSKFMSRFCMPTMAMPQEYFFWQITSSPMQFYCHSEPLMLISILVRVTKMMLRLSWSKRHFSYLKRRGSIFI